MKIAFMGESGSGKDYIVNILKKDFGFVRFSFSDQLKKLGEKIYPWMERDYPPETKELPLNIEIPETGEIISKSPREIWLELNCLRNIEDGLFIRMLAEEMKLVRTTKTVISDVRPEVEYNWCKKQGIPIIAVIPDQNPKHPQNDFDDFVRKVIKEKLYDFAIINDFSGERNIKEQLEKILGELNEKH